MSGLTGQLNASAADSTRCESPTGLVTPLVWMAIAVVPVNLEVVLFRSPGTDDALHRVSVIPADAPLLGLLALLVVRLASRAPAARRDPVLLALALLCITGLISLAFHPTWRGVQSVVRLAEAVALGWGLALSLRGRLRSATLVVLAVSALIQGTLGVAQVVRGEVLGLSQVGEYPPLLPFGTSLAAKGTFTHPYLLAGHAAVIAVALAVTAGSAYGCRRYAAAAAAGLCAVPLGLTYSRMSVIALFGVTVVLTLPWRSARIRPLAAGSLLLGAGIPAVIASDGWWSRAAQTTGATSLDAATSSRMTFFHQAGELFWASPWTGVGPGRYAEALAQEFNLPAADLYPVHNVPALLAVEGGAVTALVLVGVAWMLVRASLVGRPAIAMLVCYTPFLLLDHPISHPQGVGTLGLWLGLLLSWQAPRPITAGAPCARPARPTQGPRGASPQRAQRCAGP